MISRKPLVNPFALAVIGLGLGSCSTESGEDCVQISRAALELSILNASNDAPVCGAAIEVTRNGDAETVNAGPPPRCGYSSGKVPGNYTVNVTADGYLPADPVTVEVPKDAECPQPVTQEITVRLEQE